ncbi:IS66 family transposase [Enhygromyxa salina]|uniref:IS66 family transposase n=1 Tax=Enhygromyxa salina TaxID=215803 RepID=UPI0015E5DB7E|nr:transposase [Enhygromyxa salina]
MPEGERACPTCGEEREVIGHSFKRLGLPLSISTLCDQIKWGAERLVPLWLEAIDQVLGARVMHLDGSGLDVLARDHAKGKRRGALWGMAGATSTKPEVAAYVYASTKKAQGQRPRELGPSDILALREGIVVLDMDTLFTAQRKRPELIDCGCNMHARRYFVKALDSGDTRAALVIGAFKALYQVEDEVRDASDAERLAARREHSTPCYDDMVSWCRAYEPDVPPKSPLGRAIGYLLKHQLALRRFESDGGIPIDNMAAEHNFVPVALTRKNFLFAGSDAGAERAAVVYTILRQGSSSNHRFNFPSRISRRRSLSANSSCNVVMKNNWSKGALGLRRPSTLAVRVSVLAFSSKFRTTGSCSARRVSIASSQFKNRSSRSIAYSYFISVSFSNTGVSFPPCPATMPPVPTLPRNTCPEGEITRASPTSPRNISEPSVPVDLAAVTPPPRLLIWGTSASNKSTFSARARPRRSHMANAGRNLANSAGWYTTVASSSSSRTRRRRG